jgi:ribosomal protein S4
MGRSTGPVERLSRREGVELGLKGERASISSGPGVAVGVARDSPVAPLAAAATEWMSAVAPWLEVDVDLLWGRVLRQPGRHEISTPVDEQLIVELYAR